MDLSNYTGIVLFVPCELEKCQATASGIGFGSYRLHLVPAGLFPFMERGMYAEKSCRGVWHVSYWCDEWKLPRSCFLRLVGGKAASGLRSACRMSCWTAKSIDLALIPIFWTSLGQRAAAAEVTGFLKAFRHHVLCTPFATLGGLHRSTFARADHMRACCGRIGHGDQRQYDSTDSVSHYFAESRVDCVEDN
jgi:hypothetical protein